MIKVYVKTNTNKKDVTAEINDTPSKVLNDLGIDTATLSVNLDGEFLSKRDLDMTFEALGKDDGSNVYLTSIVKADGANK